MFYLRYVAAELRRRKGRTILTSLGLAVGVGLVVTVTALSAGLDDAQSEVLDPLTGVGTDLSVDRPLVVEGSGEDQQFTPGGPGAGLSAKEQRQLERENGGARFGLENLGDPGERFEDDNFMSTDLSFPANEQKKIAAVDGVEGVAGGLTLSAIHISGTVPKESETDQGALGGPPAAGGAPNSINLEQSTVSGVDLSEPELGLLTAGQVEDGSYFRGSRVNVLQVRADSADNVASVADAIESSFNGAEVTTADELADQVSGSLVDAKDLTSKLGTALAIVALGAAFGIASLLTLSSVNKRIRELGTLKALGWRQWLVVRQVSGESVTQGLIGGAAGALLGIGGAVLIGALGISLDASIAAEQSGLGPPGGGPFGQGAVEQTASTVSLGAPVDLQMILMAIALAVLGELIAGSVGGLRAARLRPAAQVRRERADRGHRRGR